MASFFQMQIKSTFLLFTAFVLGLFISISMAQQAETKSPESNLSDAVFVSHSDAAPQDEPEEKKITIKDVMKKAHGKDGLTKKVATGKASDEEKKELQTLYEAMAKLKQPKGTDKSWKALNDSLVEAAKLAVAGDATAPKKLKAASNCKGCHKLHKK